jgi:outer membrane lipoprotein-sorting protein
MRLPRFLLLGLVTALLVSAPGCLFRTRTVQIRQSAGPLLTATLDELVDKINVEAGKVQSLNATVNIDTSVGGAKKGKVTDFQEISGYILLRRPSMIRMIGLFPLVRNKAFDMVSDGNEFKLWIPVKNKFYVGHNDVVNPGANPLESLRPQAIYDALILHRIDPEKDIAVLESDHPMLVDEKTKRVIQQATYVVDVVTKDADGKYYLQRKIIFDRNDLIPDHQVFFDKQGAVSTEAEYQSFKYFDNVRFPTVILIKRPQEEYDITLGITKVTLNEPLKDDQFALEQPPGSQLVNLDQPNVNAAAGAQGSAAPAATQNTSPH